MPRPEFRNNDIVIDEIIRVNHAGEYAAVKIYEGQIENCQNEDEKVLMTNMMKDEKNHLQFFKENIISRGVRPTIMLPVWNVVGKYLGTISALYSTKGAMMVTESVEKVINQHYLEQIQYLSNRIEYKDLKDKIEQFRLEELEHHDIAINHGSRETILYNLWSRIVEIGCKIAIKVSKKI